MVHIGTKRPHAAGRFLRSTGFTLISGRGNGSRPLRWMSGRVRVGHRGHSRLLRPRFVRLGSNGERPGSKGILQLEERRGEGWKVAEENAGQAVVGNPVHPFRRVGGFVEVGGKERIAVKGA